MTKDVYVKKTEHPILIIAEGQLHKLQIGPRPQAGVPLREKTELGYPTFLQFTPWSRIQIGFGAGKPLCCIELTRRWYKKYIKDKMIHKWFDTYDKLIAYFEKDTHYQFGCPVCGETISSMEEYEEHIEGHKKALAGF